MPLPTRASVTIFLLAAVATSGCANTRQKATAVTIAVTTTVTPTAATPRKLKPLRPSALEQLALHRFNAWWWTDERAAYLLETNASSALHDAPEYANLRLSRAKCTAAGRTTRYRASKPLAQRFTCTVHTSAGVSDTTNGPTLTVTVLALTRDTFDVDVRTGD